MLQGRYLEWGEEGPEGENGKRLWRNVWKEFGKEKKGRGAQGGASSPVHMYMIAGGGSNCKIRK